MASFNKTILAGNLARDPEIRYTQGSDLAVVRTALAVNSKLKDKQEVMFIDIVAFGKLAEIFGKYTKKGAPVLIEGRLTQNTWEQDGQKRSKHEIVVESLQLLGNGKREDNAAAGNSFGDIPF